MDIDLVVRNINGTTTVERKNGIQQLSAIINEYFETNIGDENHSRNNEFRELFNDSSKMDQLFMSLGRLLRDPDWQIKRDTLNIIIDMIIKQILKNSNIDSNIEIIFRYLMNCLSDNKVLVRKSAIQCFHEYLKRTNNFDLILRNFVELGLGINVEFSQRRDNCLALQLLLTPNFSSHDYFQLVIDILSQLKIDDSRIVGIAADVLKSIKKLVGEERFNKYIQQLPTDVLYWYNQCLNLLESSETSTPATTMNGKENGKILPPKKFSFSSITNTNLYYGFIPESVIKDIENDRKLEAAEEVKLLFDKLKSDKLIPNILPYLPEILLLIQRLMEDKYFVLMTAFGVLIDIVENIPTGLVNQHLDSFLQLLRLALAQNMNSDAIIQKHIMMYSMILFQKSDTQKLLKKLCDSQFMNDPKQASVRQTSIDIIISALLKFPRSQFDLNYITTKICHRLTDKKSKVKQAALECISVIGYNFGNEKINVLLKSIEQCLNSDSAANIMTMVQNRLSKHNLPHVDDQGIVIYVIDNEKSQRQHSRFDFDTSSSDNSPISSANALEMRRPSAGKVRGRAKLPWDQNEGNIQKSVPFSKAPGSNTQSQVLPPDSVTMNYSLGSLTVSANELINEGRTIRKLYDLPSGSQTESDKYSIRSQPVSSRFNYSNQQITNSIQSSGYSSESNTYRHQSKTEAITATNSANVTPRNDLPTSRTEDKNAVEPSPIPTKPALGRSAGSRKKDSDQMKINHGYTNGQIDSSEQETSKVELIRNSASKKLAKKIFNSSNAPLSNNGNNEIAKENSVGAKVQTSPMVNNRQQTETKSPQPKPTLSHTGVVVTGKSVVNAVQDNGDVKRKLPVKGILESGNISQRSVANENKKINHAISDNNLSDINNTQRSSPDTPTNQKTIPKHPIQNQTLPGLNEGIVGRGLNDKLLYEEESDDEPTKEKLSKTLRESVSRKRLNAITEKQLSIDAEISVNKNISSHSAPGSGTYQASHRKPPVGGNQQNSQLPSSASSERELDNGYDTIPQSRKPLRPAYGSTTPKKIKPISQIHSTSSSSSNPPSTEAPPIHSISLANPEKAIAECLNLIQNEDWENKISAMTAIQGLSQNNSDILISRPSDLHSICIALCRECKNLRSQVAKCAIQTTAQMFIYLKKSMDTELEIILSNLLSRAGDGANSFLRQDVESTLLIMIDNVTTNRIVVALVQNALDTKHVSIRRLCALNIMKICEKLGASKFLSAIKDVAGKVFIALSKFPNDSNQETRYYGRRILNELMTFSDFEKLCHKHLAQNDMLALNNAIEQIKTKGIGDSPLSSHSASLQRTGSLSRGGSAGNLVAMDSKSTLSRVGSQSMTRLPSSEFSSDDDEWVSNTCSQLSASDFRIRCEGLKALENRVETTGFRLSEKNVNKLLDIFINLLNDNNTKVVGSALTVCHRMIPFICSIFPTKFFSRYINTISFNFASKSIELREAAKNLMMISFKHLDQCQLILPCIEAINKANAKTKPILVDNISDLFSIILELKGNSDNKNNRVSGVICRHIIPELRLLLEQNQPLSTQLMESIRKLVMLSYDIVGQDLIDLTGQTCGPKIKQMVTELLS